MGLVYLTPCGECVVVVLEGIARATPVDDRYLKNAYFVQKGLRGRSGAPPPPCSPAKVRLTTSLMTQAFSTSDHTFV
jgi:hypothetical protein